MENLPIDIHYNKLLDWLVNRRHCDAQWQTTALSIREKINNAIQDMPPSEEIVTLLHGAYINYFHCVRIVVILKETEAGTKNIFGSYSSKRMKDWKEIVSLYETNGVFLAEAAQMLARNVNFEVPSVKKHISKCKQIQKDSTKKEAEYRTNENECSKKYLSSCENVGIPGKKIKRELLSLVDDLPQMLAELVRSINNLEPAVDFYENFARFSTQSAVEKGSSCKMIRHVIKNGNTTVYEWKTGNKPRVIEEPKIDSIDDDDDKADSEIDFGDDIDFGDGSTQNITLDEAIDFGEAEAGADINWGDIDTNLDIEIEEGGTTIQSPIEEESSSEGVAKGDEALSILDNRMTRTLLLDDLCELEAFFEHRLAELSADEDVITCTLFETAPPEIKLVSSEVHQMSNNCSDVIEKLNSHKIQHMLSIKNSPRFVDRLTKSLKDHLNSSERFGHLQKLMIDKRAEALEEQRSLEPKLEVIKEKTFVLKKQIEGEISKKYKDRPVNIMGEINTM